MEFLRQVRATITKFQLLEPGERVLIGVSGGADSVSLALALRELGYPFAIAHLNHGWRGQDSDEDERFVAELAAKLDVPFFSKRAEFRDVRGNLEELGRNARKAFFSAVCAAHGFSKLSLAHTRDDRVETCLLHLIRGTGLEGMVSMAPRMGNTVRPLLECSREMVEAFLHASAESWRTDASNLDTSFARNRLRLEVIPQLKASFNPRFSETLARTIDVLQQEDAWLQALTASWLDQHASESKAEISLPAQTLGAAPEALARRVIREMLQRAGSDLVNIGFDHVESVRELLHPGKSGKTIQIPGGLIVERAFDRLIASAARPPLGGFEYELPVPGELHLPDMGWFFSAGFSEGGAAANAGRVFVDGGSLGPCVKIRNWKPGDYYKPVGWPGGKLKKLFQRAHIPRSQRSRWPVIVSDSTIVWVASFPVSRDFAPSRHSRKIVALNAVME